MRAARVIAIAALLAAAATPARAQIGVMGGVNFAAVGASLDGADVDTDTRTAWHLGGFVSRGGLLGVRFGVLYSRKGFELGDASVDLDYVEIPLMLQAKFSTLRGYGGINPAVKVNCDTRNAPALDGVAFDCADSRTFEFGWKLGVGVTLLVFSLDLSYAWSITDIWEPEAGKIETRVFQVSGGIGI